MLLCYKERNVVCNITKQTNKSAKKKNHQTKCRENQDAQRRAVRVLPATALGLGRSESTPTVMESAPKSSSCGSLRVMALDSQVCHMVSSLVL